MFASLTTLSAMLGKSYDGSNATNIDFNKYHISLNRVREQIAEIANITDHIILETDTEIIAIDKLIGAYTITGATLNKFEIESESSSLDGPIINQFRTDWVESVFDEVTRNLKQTEKSIKIDTGFESGITQTIPTTSLPCKFNGTDVIYDDTVLGIIMSRKKILSERSKVSIKINGKQNIKRGTRIEFATDYADGFLVVTESRPDYLNRKTSVSGLGEIYFASI